MKRSNEKGTALIFALIFVLVLSTLAASMMFLSQSETWSSLNYRLMTQSRYGAEAGLHAAANYLMNSYTMPGGTGDPLSAYNLNSSPVTLAAGTTPIVLGTAMNGLSLNYPISGDQTAFNNAAVGTVQAGNNTVNYSVNAELISMRQVQQCGFGANQTAQLWRLTSHGDISGVRNSEVEVTALLEAHIAPCYNYAGFATASGCGSISFTGNGAVNSYDSSTASGVGTSGVNVSFQSYDGNLGSNGNVNTANNTVIAGTFSSPDTGVGNCAAGQPDALTGNLSAVTGCEYAGQTNCGSSCTSNCAATLVQLPQTVSYPPISIPSSVPSPATNISGSAVLSPCYPLATCPHNGAPYGNYGNISGSGNAVIELQPAVVGNVCEPGGIFYVNSISLSGNATIQLDPCPSTTTTPGAYQNVVVEVVGQGTTTPLTLTGNGLTNESLNATMVQFQYAGTGNITLTGNGTSAGVLLAPNAAVSFTGNGDWYGSIIANTISSTGNGAIHYDRQLASHLLMVGNWTMDTFSWSKF